MPCPGVLAPRGGRARSSCCSVALAAPLVGASLGGASTTSVTTSLGSASDSTGKKATSFSFRPWINADGRFVAFDSDSPSLVPGDTNRVRDVFVFDRGNGTVERVSQGTGGSPDQR